MSSFQQQGFHHETGRQATTFAPAVEELAKCVKLVLFICQSFGATKYKQICVSMMCITAERV